MLLVGSMDIPSIKNLKIGMQTLDLHGDRRPEAQARAEPREREGEARRARRSSACSACSANFPIPDDIAVPMSVNAGVPVVVDDPKSPVLACARAHRRVAARARRADSRKKAPQGRGKKSKDGSRRSRK